MEVREVSPIGPMGHLVSGRYRVLDVLGRGGVGAVYRVHDEARSVTVALKVLEHLDPKQLTSFEREYQTLASLRHPSVIEVHDFGRTAEGKHYYTMELLPGADLLALSPLSFEIACIHLRDVATSLSLLHARRLLHRDVSPRNVRLDRHARAKLLDFGALVSFGTAVDIVGTPPCMAPEALEGLALDPRSDLFSLGAVAYYTLTHRMPFAGRTIDEARVAQRTPPIPPAELVAGLPPALNALILQLLSPDPLARPNTAAEVIDRLSAVANLERGTLAPLADIYFRAPALIGRARESRQWKRHLTRGSRGSGGTLLLEAVPGMGRTRLSEEFCIEARIQGVAAVRVDALRHSGPGAVLRGLVRGLLEAVPDVARGALAGRQGMEELVKEPTARFQAVQEAGERTSRVTTSRDTQVEEDFVRIVMTIVEQRPLAIMVDDAHALDASSARALAHLAHRSRRTRLLLLLTAPADHPSMALQPIRRISTLMRLRPLSRGELEELVESVFGDVPHRARLCQWLHGLGRGNPGPSLELLRALLDRDLVRYAGGTWILPQELREQDLPRSIEETLEARLSNLTALELKLLRSVALYRGALPLPTCLALLRGEPREQVLRALERLLSQDLLVRSEDEFRFGRFAPRELVLSRLASAERTDLHRGLADALLETCPFLQQVLEHRDFHSLSSHAVLTVLEAGYHLQCSGRRALGSALLRDAAAELTLRGDALPDAVPMLERSVAEHGGSGRHELECAPLLAPLALAGTYSDYRLSYRYGERALTIMLEAVGLDRAVGLRRFLGPTLALYACLAIAYLRFRFTGRRELARSFREALLGLAGVGSALLGTYSVLLDRKRAQAAAERLAVFGYFPKGHPLRLVHGLQSALLASARGDAEGSARHAMAVFAELKSEKCQRAIPPEALLQLRVGCLTPSTLAYAQRLDGRSQEACAELDRMATAVSRQVVAGARAAYHGHRGERTQFNLYRDEMDMLASGAGSTWREDVGTPRQMWSTYALSEDLLELKRCVLDLDPVAADLEGIRMVRDAAQACYLAERGDAREALARYGAALEQASDDPSLMGARLAGAYARILRLADQPGRAKEICERALSRLNDEQREYSLSVLGAQLELSLATALLGQPAQALAQLDQLTNIQGRHDNPLVHGLMHKTRAQIALWSGSAEYFAEQLGLTDHWFRKTDNPSLIAQCQRLAKEARARGLGEALGVTAAEAEAARQRRSFLQAFHAVKGVRDRLQVAIDLVLAESYAERAYLYLLGTNGLRFAAPLEGSEPPESVLAELVTLIDQLRRSAQKPAPEHITTLAEGPGGSQDSVETFVPYPLCFWHGTALTVVGAIALVPGGLPLGALDPAVVEMIARALHESPDVQEVFLADVDPGRTAQARPPSGTRVAEAASRNNGQQE